MSADYFLDFLHTHLEHFWRVLKRELIFMNEVIMHLMFQ